MTADQRLGELEPILGEMAAQLDLVQAQNKRIAHGTRNVATATGQQSDTISFMLERQPQQGERLDRLETDVREVRTELREVKTELREVKSDVRMILDILRNKN